MRVRTSWSLLAVVCAAGCVTLPQGAGSGAGYVGDRASVALDEVVVSVPARDTPPYRNLHVGLSGIINPREVSLYDPYDVRSLVKRLQTRIEARLVEVLLGMGSVGTNDLPTVRERLNQEAQSIVDGAVSGWKHASEYEIRVVVTSLYFTDGSVGRQTVPDRLWW